MSLLASESFLSCLHDMIVEAGLHKLLHSPSDRRIIWWLCSSHLACSQCYKRLVPLPSPEDAKNAQTRNKSRKSAKAPDKVVRKQLSLDCSEPGEPSRS